VLAGGGHDPLAAVLQQVVQQQEGFVGAAPVGASVLESIL
jgi:hypothetical protein